MLDTHVLLWAIGNSDKLSPHIVKQISNRENEVFVSAITLWEIVLKVNNFSFGLSYNDLGNFYTSAQYFWRLQYSYDSLEINNKIYYDVVERINNDGYNVFEARILYNCIFITFEWVVFAQDSIKIQNKFQKKDVLSIEE